jgi:formate--tetrahydrofolate ligase
MAEEDQHANPRTDADIARAATPRPIAELAADTLGLGPEHLTLYGNDKAKLTFEGIDSLGDRPDGKLVLVTAITPTPAGEGKTTTTVGLGDALNRIGRRTMVCLREPSLGPCFGMKGGAAGGGYAQVVPMEDINLHFTGDFHAVGAANNLLAALLDNHIYWGNEAGIDERRVGLRRVLDMNDRALRDIVCGLGGVPNGFPREDHFDITPASEVMAVLCLADDLGDLRRRLGNIVVAERRDGSPVTARDLKADGAMAALLKDAIKPNLVQTLEHTPAFVHGGPFGNIAHGCNTVIATRAARKLADVVVTEAGFGADLGAEKFMDIKARKSGLMPDVAVVVATVRALKLHGGLASDKLDKENTEALDNGLPNLFRHVENMRTFGLPVVVAVNRFSTDTRAEIDLIRQGCAELDVPVVEADHWARGGAGAEDLAQVVAGMLDRDAATPRVLYPDEMAPWDKVRTVAQTLYGAQGIIADKKVRARFKDLADSDFGRYPVCVAKTQYSFSTDPNLKGAPSNHVVPVREVRVQGGAEFLVVVCGDIMTMPGLPRRPAAEGIGVGPDGTVSGLF